MSAPSPATDRPSPSPGADLLLVVAFLGVLLALSWGVIWVQSAATAERDTSLWLGVVPPALAALSGSALLRVRASFPSLARLRLFLTRVAVLGLGGAALLSACFGWIALR